MVKYIVVIDNESAGDFEIFMTKVGEERLEEVCFEAAGLMSEGSSIKVWQESGITVTVEMYVAEVFIDYPSGKTSQPKNKRGPMFPKKKRA